MMELKLHPQEGILSKKVHDMEHTEIYVIVHEDAEQVPKTLKAQSLRQSTFHFNPMHEKNVFLGIDGVSFDVHQLSETVK
jgi:hypothetical protein